MLLSCKPFLGFFPRSRLSARVHYSDHQHGSVSPVDMRCARSLLGVCVCAGVRTERAWRPVCPDTMSLTRSVCVETVRAWEGPGCMDSRPRSLTGCMTLGKCQASLFLNFSPVEWGQGRYPHSSIWATVAEHPGWLMNNRITSLTVPEAGRPGCESRQTRRLASAPSSQMAGGLLPTPSRGGGRGRCGASYKDTTPVLRASPS